MTVVDITRPSVSQTSSEPNPLKTTACCKLHIQKRIIGHKNCLEHAMRSNYIISISMKKLLPVIIAVLICLGLGFVANMLQADAIQNWYPYLDKSILTPPNWAFPLAWGIIYVLSGISAGLIWDQKTRSRKYLLTIWGVQQFFNLTWSIAFFTFENPLMGFVNILLLDFLVILYIAKTWHANKISSLLFLPYFAWIVFATYLNLHILIYN